MSPFCSCSVNAATILMSRPNRLFGSALLKLLFDHPVKSGANPVEVQSLFQPLVFLEAVERTFHDVRGVEAGRERARRELLECRHELEHFIHHSVSAPD